MASRTHSGIRPAPRRRAATRPATPGLTWLLVAALILGAALAGIGLAAGGAALVVIGVVLVAVAAAAAFLVPPGPTGHAISFGAEYPASTVGPRATKDGHSGPPIDTEPGQAGRPRPPAPVIGEIEAEEEASLPDRGRVLPQHVNLAPGERLRLIGGVPVVEREPGVEEEAENRAEGGTS